MIKLNKRYFVSADTNGWAFGEFVLIEKQKDDKDGKFKKGDILHGERTSKYASTIEGIAMIALEEMIRDKVAEETITTIEQLIREITETKDLIKRYIK